MWSYLLPRSISTHFQTDIIISNYVFIIDQLFYQYVPISWESHIKNQRKGQKILQMFIIMYANVCNDVMMKDFRNYIVVIVRIAIKYDWYLCIYVWRKGRQTHFTIHNGLKSFTYLQVQKFKKYKSWDPQSPALY